jgi:hypothetical protein
LRGDNRDVRLGIADHLGWAIVVTASESHEVVDRRRIELIEPGISPAPYRQGLAELAHARAWEVHMYDAKAVVDQAVSMLAERADEILQGPRPMRGPPWSKDHRIALAATIVDGADLGAAP